MRREIGSDYWITEQEYDKALAIDSDVCLPIKLPNRIYLTNLCRTGVELLLDSLNVNKGVVLLPEFTCHSVITPFLNHGFKIYSYELNNNLTINLDVFSKKVKDLSPNIILLHSYFGFDNIEKNIKELAPAALIIEDLTQRLFSSFPLLDAHCYVGSIRKWMSVPDGGFYCGQKQIDLPDEEDDEFINLELNALLLKGKYMKGEEIDKSAFRSLFSEARQTLKNKSRCFSMSTLSQKIYNSFNFEKFIFTRQENARYLIERIQKFDFLELPLSEVTDSTVPFMVPVFVKTNRQEFQKHLANHDVYATVIWTCPESIRNQLSSNGKYIYEHILCFHCDQRYDLDDMQRIINVINDY